MCLDVCWLVKPDLVGDITVLFLSEVYEDIYAVKSLSAARLGMQ